MNIKKINTSFISFLLILTIILAIFPTMSFAAPQGPFNIKILNEVKDETGKFVDGAEYNIYKKYDWASDGNYIKLKEPELVNNEPIKVSKHGTTYQVSEPGVYDIVQVKRAPGYYAFGTFQENNEEKPLAMTVEFPKMTNGSIDSNQEIVVSPKLDPVLADIGLFKMGEKTSLKDNGLNDVAFRLVQTHDVKLEKLDTPVVISERVETSSGGFIKLANIREGRYELQEKGVKSANHTSEKEIFANKDGDHLYDSKPVRFTLTTNDAGTKTRAYIHDVQGNVLKELEKHDKADQENTLKTDYYVDKTNYLTPSITKDVEGKEEYHSNLGVPMEFGMNTTVPTNIKDYKTFKLVDNLDKRLDYVKDSVKVKLDGKEVAKDVFLVEFDSSNKVLEVSLNLNRINHQDFAGKDLRVSFLGQLNRTSKSGDPVPNTAELVIDNGFGVVDSFKSNTVSISPQEGSVSIIKIEKGNRNKKLSGAVFVLKDKDTGKVATDVDGVEFKGVTGVNGQLNFDKVPFGNYELVEEKAPLGYLKSNETFDVVLNDKVQNLEYNFLVENTPDGSFIPPQDDPNTGSSKPLMMIGLGVMLLGVYFFINKKEDI